MDTFKSLSPLISSKISDSLLTNLENVRKNIDASMPLPSFPDFTDHSIRHADRVLRLAEQIVNSFSIKLSSGESYILLSSIYLHDIGYFVRDSLSNRNSHAGVSAKIINNAIIQGKFGLFLDIPQGFVHQISDICMYHNNPFNLSSLLYDVHINNEFIRSKLLGCLLFFADNLDAGEERVLIDNLYKVKADLKTRLFWYRHSCIRNVAFENYKVIFTIVIPTTISDEINNQLILEPVKQQIQNNFKYINSIFSIYDIHSAKAIFNTLESPPSAQKMTSIITDTANIESKIREKTKERKTILNKKITEKGLINKKVINNELIILRRWSSYTPRLPQWNHDGNNRVPYAYESRGGGYFLIWNGVGIAIDPGYDFLRNLWEQTINGTDKFSLEDIHAAVISHAHDDHTHDIEPIISLINKKRNLAKTNDTLNVYCSEGVHIKYERLISINSFVKITDLVSNGKVETLIAESDFLSAKGVQLEYLLTHHNELPWMKIHTGIALKFRLSNHNNEINIGFTSDSQYFPELVRFMEDVDLVIMHFGNIGPMIGENPQYDKNHLGMNGCHDLISALIDKSPKYFLIDEFGEEEIGDDRITLCRLLSNLTCLEEKNKYLLPMDIGMRIKLPEANVYCQEHKLFEPFDKIIAHLDENAEAIRYYCR